MKKLLIASAVAMTLSASAYAEPTTQLKLTGLLTNDACSPTLSESTGVVDFGTHHISNLKATEDNQMGYKDLTLTIECSVASKVSWNISDNKQSTVTRITIENAGMGTGAEAWSTSDLFGAGVTAGNVNIGAYSVAVDYNNSMVDSTKAALLFGSPDAVTTGVGWVISDSDARSLGRNDGFQNFTVGEAGNAAPVAFKLATFPIRVALAIEDTNTLAITDTTPIDGSATITLHYL